MNNSMRQAFEKAQRRFPNAIISPHSLRVEVPLNSKKNTYPINVKEGNANTDGKLDIRLNDNDAFALVYVGIGLKKQDRTNNKYGNQQVFTNPDPQYFVATGAAGVSEEHEALMCVYNGKLSFKTGSTTRIKALSTRHFLYVPEQQVAKQAAPLINDGLLQVGGCPEKMGMVDTYAWPLLDGSLANEFSLELGEGDITLIGGTAGTGENMLIVECYGFLIEGGAQAAKQWNGWN